jgi:hypothetical protein
MKLPLLLDAHRLAISFAWGVSKFHHSHINKGRECTAGALFGLKRGLYSK